MSLANRTEFSPGEVAILLSTEAFKVSRRAVLRMIERRELRAWRQNRRVIRIARADLEEYIRSRYVAGPAAPRSSNSAPQPTQLTRLGTTMHNSELLVFLDARRVAAS